jgi:hypothetical protein
MVISPDDPWAQELQTRHPAVYRALERSRGRITISAMPERYQRGPRGHSRNGFTQQQSPRDFWIMYNPTRSPDELLRALPHEPIHALYGVKHSRQREPPTRLMQPPIQYAQRIADTLDPAILGPLIRDGVTSPQEQAVWAMAENILRRAR